MADSLFMPSSGGGLMRYNEEYKSKLMLKPSHVVILLILIIAFVIGLKIFFKLDPAKLLLSLL